MVGEIYFFYSKVIGVLWCRNEPYAPTGLSYWWYLVCLGKEPCSEKPRSLWRAGGSVGQAKTEPKVFFPLSFY